MKKLLLSIVAVALVALAPMQAKAVQADAAIFAGSSAGIVAGGFTQGATVIGMGIVTSPIILTALVAENVDPWHPIACALFGDDARVGTETTAHCK